MPFMHDNAAGLVLGELRLLRYLFLTYSWNLLCMTLTIFTARASSSSS